jgi:hypothetical protein
VCCVLSSCLSYCASCISLCFVQQCVVLCGVCAAVCCVVWCVCSSVWWCVVCVQQCVVLCCVLCAAVCCVLSVQCSLRCHCRYPRAYPPIEHRCQCILHYSSAFTTPHPSLSLQTSPPSSLLPHPHSPSSPLLSHTQTHHPRTRKAHGRTYKRRLGEDLSLPLPVSVHQLEQSLLRTHEHERKMQDPGSDNSTGGGEYLRILCP